MSIFLDFIGRLHPVVLHAPIGLLIGLAAVDVASLRTPMPRRPRAILVWLAAIGAVLAVLTGLSRAEVEGHAGIDAQWHQWLGIGVAAGTLLAAVLHHACRGPGASRAVVLLTAIVVIPAGHLGGTLTHGKNFLLEPFITRAPVDPSLAVGAGGGFAGEPGSFAATMAVFDAYCVSCHGPKRSKSGLRLDSAEGIGAGGDAGAILVPGDPGASEIVRRMRLPLEDDDHMPPESKPQPSAGQIELIEKWIRLGAPTTGGASGGPTGGAVGASSPVVPAVEPESPADERAVARLRAALVYVQPAFAGSAELELDFAAASLDEAGVIEHLGPVGGHVRGLMLARVPVGDEAMRLVAGMPRLRRLDLSRTRVTDAGLAVLAGHKSLEHLVLTRTAISDASVEALGSMPALRRVYLWKSGVTPEGAAALRARRPGLVVSLGDEAAASPLETEGPLKFSSDAPLPEAEPAVSAAAGAALTPVNTVCPVSGAAADPRYQVVHEGTVVGFCCPNCPAKFWADPKAYLAKIRGTP